MILAIEQYLEALGGSDGRFRTLETVYPVVDEQGAVFAVPGHGLVDFEVISGGVRLTLRCPLRYGAEASARLRALGGKDAGLGSRFFTEWSLLEREVVLFDIADRAIEVDILMRPVPVGERLADFLGRASAAGNFEVIGAALHSFGELLEWTHSVGRSGITRRRLLVAPDGAVSITGFSAGDESNRIAEMMRAAAAGEKVEGISAGKRREPTRYGYDFQDSESDIRCVRDGGGWMYVNHRGHPVIDAVWLAATPFREGRAEVETRTGKGLIDRDGKAVLEPIYEELVWDDYWNLAAVMVEGNWSLVDRDGVTLTPEPFDWLGECSEGMVLAQKDGKCGFVDAEGRLAIPCIYDDASSFAEGCALVTAGGESFFIDAGGEKI